MRRASQSDGPHGLRITHGLVGSDQWWASQLDGSLPVVRLEGLISGFWPGQWGDGPSEFELTVVSGAKSTWFCGTAPNQAARVFKIGRRAAVTYVEQQLKTEFAGSTSTKVVTAIALG